MELPAFTNPPANDPAKRGERATHPCYLGENNRYEVAAIHTRFDALEWFVWDHHFLDHRTGKPAVVRQALSFELATEGLA